VRETIVYHVSVINVSTVFPSFSLIKRVAKVCTDDFLKMIQSSNDHTHFFPSINKMVERWTTGEW